jgi:hypothetical protein
MADFILLARTMNFTVGQKDGGVGVPGEVIRFETSQI